MIVRKLLEWMKTAPVGRRVEAVRALARAYLHSNLDATVREAMEAAMTVILDDPSPDVRFALADELSNSPEAPRHVIIALVGDRVDIAALTLSRSPVLLDVELVDFFASAEVSLQVAIAQRRPVARTLAAAVAEVGMPAACQALLANDQAELTRASLKRLAERFGDFPDIRQMLFDRPELTVEVQQVLVRQLSQSLSGLVGIRARFDPVEALAVSGEACERATVALAAEADRDSLADLVVHLRDSGQLTTALLLRALCCGNVAFFELALVALSGVPEARVVSLVRGGRITALRAVYSRADLPAVAFDAFAAALETCREIVESGSSADGYRFARLMVDRILARYQAISDGEMSELLAMVRRFTSEAARSAARGYFDDGLEAA